MVKDLDPLLVRQFAEELQVLRVRCGKPTYEEIGKLAARHGRPLPRSSITDLLKGTRLPKLPSVHAFVRAVLHHRDGTGANSEHEAEVRQWSEKWSNVQTGSRAVAQPRTAVPPRVTPGPVEKPEVPETPKARVGPEDVPSRAVRAPTDAAGLRPRRTDVMSREQRRFRDLLDRALDEVDDQGRPWSAARYGCYAFYDFDGDPIYVGSSGEHLRTRIRRHLVNQRTDAVATGVLDVREVAEVELWPVWSLEGTPDRSLAIRELARIEWTVYVRAINESQYGMLLNERTPPSEEIVELPPSKRFLLVDDEFRLHQGHDDVRIARRAEILERLTSAVLERGVVSEGARRALVVQAARLTHLAATRLAFAEGRPPPSHDNIYLHGLVGSAFRTEG